MIKCAHCASIIACMLVLVHAMKNASHDSGYFCKGNNNSANYKIPSSDEEVSAFNKCIHLRPSKAMRSEAQQSGSQATTAEAETQTTYMTKLNGSRMCIGAMHGPMQNFCKSAFNQYMCEYVLLTKVSSHGVG